MNKKLNKKEMMETAYLSGIKGEQSFGGCAQCTLYGLIQATGEENKISNDMFKAATGLAAGISMNDSVCGAVTGAVMYLGSFTGRGYDELDNADKKRNSYRISNLLVEKFKEEYGTINCPEIQKKIMGRSYKMSDPEEFKAFDEAGGHREYCPKVCGNGAKWVIDILFDEGFLKEEN